MLRRTRQDHIKERQGRKCSEKVHAGNGHAVAKAVRTRILQRRKRRIRIDVKRQDFSGTGACCRESENTGPGANISHALTAQVEPVEVFREILATKKEARVEHGRSNAQVEARCSDRPDAPAAEDEVIGKEMNEGTQKAAEWSVSSALNETAYRDCGYVDSVRA